MCFDAFGVMECGVIILMTWFDVPANIYLLKVTRTRREICSKLTLRTPERRQWHRTCIFIVYLEHISHLVLVFLLLALNMQLLAGVMLLELFLWSDGFGITWFFLYKPFHTKLPFKHIDIPIYVCYIIYNIIKLIDR